MPDKFFKLTEDVLSVTHTRERAKMEEDVCPITVLKFKDCRMMDNALIAQHIRELKEMELSVDQTNAT
jgi:hypothetical protein